MQLPPFGIGGIIAIAVFILVILLAIIGHLPVLLAGLIGALALARLT